MEHNVLIINGETFSLENTIHHILTAGYHPQSNPVPRYNSETGRILSAYCKDHTMGSEYELNTTKFLNNMVSECH